MSRPPRKPAVVERPPLFNEVRLMLSWAEVTAIEQALTNSPLYDLPVASRFRRLAGTEPESVS